MSLITRYAIFLISFWVENFTLSHLKWHLKRQDQDKPMSFNWRATFLMGAVNIGLKHPMNIDLMMIIIIGHWHLNGWTALDKLRKVRTLISTCVGTISLHATSSWLSWEDFSKSTVLSSVTDWYPCYLYFGVSTKDILPSHILPFFLCLWPFFLLPSLLEAQCCFSVPLCRRSMSNRIRCWTHNNMDDIDTTYILSALPKDYAIYTKTRKNGTHVS